MGFCIFDLNLTIFQYGVSQFSIPLWLQTKLSSRARCGVCLMTRGVHSYGGYPKNAGWFLWRENHIYKWMMSGGTPMTLETFIYGLLGVRWFYGLVFSVKWLRACCLVGCLRKYIARVHWNSFWYIYLQYNLITVVQIVPLCFSNV